MFFSLCRSLRKPSLYQESSAHFADDPFISEQLLQAHLNPDFEGASRSFTVIDRSVAWIHSQGKEAHPALLDFGCGPGLYCFRFAKLGG